MMSSGPRSSILVSTAAGEVFLKFAAEASNSGWPGPGMAHLSNSACDSVAGRALPKP